MSFFCFTRTHIAFIQWDVAFGLRVSECFGVMSVSAVSIAASVINLFTVTFLFDACKVGTRIILSDAQWSLVWIKSCHGMSIHYNGDTHHPLSEKNKIAGVGGNKAHTITPEHTAPRPCSFFVLPWACESALAAPPLAYIMHPPLLALTYVYVCGVYASQNVYCATLGSTSVPPLLVISWPKQGLNLYALWVHVFIYKKTYVYVYIYIYLLEIESISLHTRFNRCKSTLFYNFQTPIHHRRI